MPALPPPPPTTVTLIFVAGIEYEALVVVITTMLEKPVVAAVDCVVASLNVMFVPLTVTAMIAP
jgi:hypothetical protein